MVSAVESGGALLGVVLGCERDLVSKLLELSDEASGEPVGALAREVVAAEVAVQLADSEHVPGGSQDRVADRGDRFAVPALRSPRDLRPRVLSCTP